VAVEVMEIVVLEAQVHLVAVELVVFLVQVEVLLQVKEIQVAVQTEALLEETLTLAVAAVEKEAQAQVDHLLLLEELV
jgi:hypothetical protein|tara:strand:+ start:245 stop:478 length:234 start_codon:yes stop_codon:yes gene_type:complete